MAPQKKAPPERRRKSGTPSPTRRVTAHEVNAFTSEVLATRIAWRAARAFLQQVLEAEGASALDYELRERITAFLKRHP